MIRLQSAAEFQRVRREGRSYAHPLAVLLVCANARPQTRVAVAASRAVGEAVERNRAKRLLREAVRLQSGALAPGWDLILIARRPLAGSGLRQAQGAVMELLRRAKVLRRAEECEGDE
jgi:ribonuclease P protein component